MSSVLLLTNPSVLHEIAQMETREWLLQQFRALCDRTIGGVDAVAVEAGLSPENLRNLYSSDAIKLKKTGNARGLGPEILRKLDAAYEGWLFVGLPSGTPTVGQALPVVVKALSGLSPGRWQMVRARLDALVDDPILDVDGAVDDVAAVLAMPSSEKQPNAA